MLPQQDVQKYGGKAAILNHIRERLPDMPIPRYVVKEAGDSAYHSKSEFIQLRKPCIVRSSSPHEYGDFEGIFETVHDVHNYDALVRAVNTVERSATSARAKK